MPKGRSARVVNLTNKNIAEMKNTHPSKKTYFIADEKEPELRLAVYKPFVRSGGQPLAFTTKNTAVIGRPLHVRDIYKTSTEDNFISVEQARMIASKLRGKSRDEIVAMRKVRGFRERLEMDDWDQKPDIEGHDEAPHLFDTQEDEADDMTDMNASFDFSNGWPESTETFEAEDVMESEFEVAPQEAADTIDVVEVNTPAVEEKPVETSKEYALMQRQLAFYKAEFAVLQEETKKLNDHISELMKERANHLIELAAAKATIREQRSEMLCIEDYPAMSPVAG